MGHQVSMGEEIPQDWEAPHDFMRSFEGSARAIAISEPHFAELSDPTPGRASPSATEPQLVEVGRKEMARADLLGERQRRAGLRARQENISKEFI